MFRSMTAYGRAFVSSPMGDISFEMVSLNRKFLEIRLHLPQELTRFEPFVRGLFDGKVNRGGLQVKVQVEWKGELPVEIHPNMPLIQKFLQMRQEVEKKFGVASDAGQLMDWVFEQEGTIVTLETEQQDGEIAKWLQEAFGKAFAPFCAMKEREGVSLWNDVQKRVGTLEAKIREIAEKAPAATAKYREKISKILAEFAHTPEDRERVFKEAALFADRVDIAEEITRFRSHLQQLGKTSEGKTWDFLLQEMLREINTIGNKAQDSAVSSLVILMKAELEKIREQVQNVE